MGTPRASISNRSASLIPSNPERRKSSSVLSNPNLLSQRRVSNVASSPSAEGHQDEEKPEEEEEDEEVFTDRNLAFQSKLSKKPCRLLSMDGMKLENPWFIPHHSDIMEMLSEESMVSQVKQLCTILDIAFAVHDIFMFFYAQARLSLGKYEPYLPQHKSEGIASEMHKIQMQIENLRNSKSPRQVADLLSAWRSVLFSGYDYTMRYTAVNGLLLRKRISAFQILKADNQLGMQKFKHTSDSVYSTYFTLPDLLDNASLTKTLYPYRWYAHHYGPCPGFLGIGRNLLAKLKLVWPD